MQISFTPLYKWDVSHLPIRQFLLFMQKGSPVSEKVIKMTFMLTQRLGKTCDADIVNVKSLSLLFNRFHPQKLNRSNHFPFVLSTYQFHKCLSVCTWNANLTNVDQMSFTFGICIVNCPRACWVQSGVKWTFNIDENVINR